MITQFVILGLLAVLCSIGLRVFFKRRTRYVRLANIAEGTHGDGRITKLTDAAISGRFRVVKFGSDAAHIAVAVATDVSIGICTDEASAAEMPVSIAILGASPGTHRVLLGGTVAAGDELSPTTGGAAIKLPTATGTYYPFGRALAAGVSGDVIEIVAHMVAARVVP